MNPYTYLLFDLDGTLLDFDAAEEQALTMTFQQYGIPLDSAMKRYYLDLNARLWDAYEKGQYDRDDIVRTRFKQVFETFHIEESGEAFGYAYQAALGMGHVCLPNAREVISALSKNYRMSIVTNGTAHTQYRRIEEAGLSSYFEHIFISDEIGYRKPMIEYFDYCLHKLNDIPSDQILLIGD